MVLLFFLTDKRCAHRDIANEIRKGLLLGPRGGPRFATPCQRRRIKRGQGSFNESRDVAFEKEANGTKKKGQTRLVELIFGSAPVRRLGHEKDVKEMNRVEPMQATGASVRLVVSFPVIQCGRVLRNQLTVLYLTRPLPVATPACNSISICNTVFLSFDFSLN